MTTDFIVTGDSLRSQPDGDFIATPMAIYNNEGYWTAQIQYHETQTGGQLGALYLRGRYPYAKYALKAAEDQMWENWMEAIAPMVVP